MKKLPQWVLKHKTKGTQVVQIGNNYYLYKITSVWDRQKGRARKVTEKYLGKITKEGLIKPKHERAVDTLKQITVKEFGATVYLMSLTEDVVELLREHFPECWQELYIFSQVRFFYSSSIRNILHYYSTSELSERFSGARVSGRSVSKVVKEVGAMRQKVVEFLRNFLKADGYQVIDLTHVFSYSEDVISSTIGYNSEGQYIPQINLVMIFSLKDTQPCFFRAVSGSIRDVSAFQRTIQEAQVTEAVIIADKGFYSEGNLRFMEGEGLKYIIPLKRNSRVIDYRVFKSGDRREFDGYFLFDKRVIWYKEGQDRGRRVILYFDEGLRAEEEKDLLGHVEEGRIKVERYYEVQHRLGSIGVITNTGFGASEVYELLKGRVQIEQSFDVFKNLIHADRLYVRDDVALNGWMFVNFLSLVFYYKVYMELRRKGLLKKYSVKDAIVHLSRIYKLKVGDKWIVSEIPKSSRKLLEQLNFQLPIT